MPTRRSPTFLQRALLADAAASGVAGILLAAVPGRFGQHLGAPEPAVLATGLALLVYAGLIAWIGSRESPPRPAVWAVIVLNAVWAVDCVLLLLGGWIEPSGVGTMLVLVQAAVVALFAELQYLGLRRVAAAAA